MVADSIGDPTVRIMIMICACGPPPRDTASQPRHAPRKQTAGPCLPAGRPLGWCSGGAMRPPAVRCLRSGPAGAVYAAVPLSTHWQAQVRARGGSLKDPLSLLLSSSTSHAKSELAQRLRGPRRRSAAAPLFLHRLGALPAQPPGSSSAPTRQRTGQTRTRSRATQTRSLPTRTAPTRRPPRRAGGGSPPWSSLQCPGPGRAARATK